MTDTNELLAEARHMLDEAAVRESGLNALADSALLESMELVEEISRRLDVFKARRAGEAARRSAPEFGNDGLAARHGHLNPQALVRAITRSSFAEAARRVRVGLALLSAEVSDDRGEALGGPGRDAQADPTRPAEAEAATEQTSGFDGGPTHLDARQPFDSIAGAVADGRLGIDAADRVIRALEPIASVIEPSLFHQATSALAGEGATQNADQLGVMARRTRDTLDAQGVLDRHEYLRSRRSLRRSGVVDGLRHVNLVLDPESDGILFGAIDAAMSPRLGGPRFVDPEEQARAESLREDTRTNEQIALDTLVDLVTSA